LELSFSKNAAKLQACLSQDISLPGLGKQFAQSENEPSLLCDVPLQASVVCVVNNNNSIVDVIIVLNE
jgi:hypothetical protein